MNSEMIRCGTYFFQFAMNLLLSVDVLDRMPAFMEILRCNATDIQVKT